MSDLSNLFAYSLQRQFMENKFLDGIGMAVTLYYDNYTDATELHGEFFRALHEVGKHVEMYEEDINEAISFAERDYNEHHPDRHVFTPEAANAEDEAEDEEDEEE
jgi:hypothetical protein